MSENSYWKIATIILILILIIVIFWFVMAFKMDESYVDGYNQGRVDIINLNSQGRFVIYNNKINKTQEYTLGNLCSLPEVR